MPSDFTVHPSKLQALNFHEGNSKRIVINSDTRSFINQVNLIFMTSLIKKKEGKTSKVAQCCAKTSKIVAGCHD
jgi:hypothetical protein